MFRAACYPASCFLKIISFNLKSFSALDGVCHGLITNLDTGDIVVGKLFVVWAPSGAGKTSLVLEVLRRIGSSYSLNRVVTYTTKQPRSTEIPSQDYHFVSLEEFKQKIDQGFFLEWSTAFGEYYGSPASLVEDIKRGFSFVIIVDLKGACRIQAIIPEAIFIKIAVSDYNSIEDRLKHRGTESISEISKRLEVSAAELIFEKDLCLFKYLVLNDNFEIGVARLSSIIELEYAATSLKK
jgi:guanylate kinase